jgi:hypothetical protein
MADEKHLDLLRQGAWRSPWLETAVSVEYFDP